MSRQIKDVHADTFVGTVVSPSSGSLGALLPVGLPEAISASDVLSAACYSSIVTTGSNLTVQLPTGLDAGQLKLVRKTAGANTLVVHSSDLSGGYSTATLASDSAARSVLFQWDSVNGLWNVVDYVGASLA